MNTRRARAALVSFLAFASFVTAFSASAVTASAVGISGTWVSAVPGEGYTQEDVIYAWYYDVELHLSQSAEFIYGEAEMTLLQVDLKVPTYPPWPYELPSTETYQVDGYLTGSTLTMTMYTDTQPIQYVLTVSDGFMTGSGTYDSAGATIYWTFDLEKGSAFEALAFTGSVIVLAGSGAAIAIAVAAIAVASVPFRPKGAATRPQPQQLQPSQVYQTGDLQAPSLGVGTPVGGIGLHYPPSTTAVPIATGQIGTFAVVVRPISPAEMKAAEASAMPLRTNAMGLAVLSMVMAVMVNFILYEWTVLVPVFFAALSLGTAFSAKSKMTAVGVFLDKGTVFEIRGVPEKRSMGRGWAFGPVSFTSTRGISSQLSQGSPASITIAPELKLLLAVNGAPLKSPADIMMAPGTDLAAHLRQMEAAPPMRSATQAKLQAEDVPPPPDDWAPRQCPKCGRAMPSEAVFCPWCGLRF